MFSRFFSIFLNHTPSQDVTNMWILVGLGNPGKEYKDNRHNIGFMVIDEIAREYGFPAFRAKFEGEITEGRIGDEKVVLVKPQTFMNLSGECVQKIARFYKVTPNRIIAIHDEIELPTGKMRTKKGGGAAGHNGLKSMDINLNSQNYWRVRLGVGKPKDEQAAMDVADYVLGNFTKIDMVWVDKLKEAVSNNIGLLLKGDDSEFMNKVTIATRVVKAGNN